MRFPCDNLSMMKIPNWNKLLDAYRLRNQMMMRLREEGMSDAAIARRYKLTRARIGAILGAKNGKTK